MEQLMTSSIARKNKSNLVKIAQRATIRKANPNLRHMPTNNDVLIASEHAKLMIYHQYQSISVD